jgi:hypothetical protein
MWTPELLENEVELLLTLLRRFVLLVLVGKVTEFLGDDDDDDNNNNNNLRTIIGVIFYYWIFVMV